MNDRFRFFLAKALLTYDWSFSFSYLLSTFWSFRIILEPRSNERSFFFNQVHVIYAW